MSYLTGNEQFARDLLEALGVKAGCLSVELRVAKNEAVTLTTETYVADDMGPRIVKAVQKFDIGRAGRMIPLQTLCLVRVILSPGRDVGTKTPQEVAA